MVREAWASALLTWELRRLQLVAEISRGTYRVQAFGPEVLAWAEIRDTCGHRRCEIGSFRDVAAAKAACERDAQLRVRAGERERGPVDVRIAPPRR